MSPLFEFIFVASMWSGYITASGIFGGDGLFLGICSHLSGQFDVIGSRISTLIEQEIGKNGLNMNTGNGFDFFFFVSFLFAAQHESLERLTPRQNDHLYEKLKEIIVEHNLVIDLCGVMSKTFAPNVLIHFITSALITCICCLMIMLAEGASKLIFVNYIIASTTQVYVYAIGGTMLEDASTKIATKAYNFQWYKCNNRVQKQILMLITRAQRKTAINVPFLEATLETFGVVRVKIILLKTSPKNITPTES